MAAWISCRLPTPNSVVLESITELQGHLYPEEDALLSRAVPKREREFRSGRTAARKAMLELGIETFPILIGAKREPVWPASVVGTISHSGDKCLVILGKSREILSFGADIEQLGRIKKNLWKKIFRPGETEYLLSLNTRQRDFASTTIFSAKEAFFKFQYPLTKEWLEFLDVEVRIEDNSNFTVEVSKPHYPTLASNRFNGICARLRNYCITAMGLPR